MRGLETTSDLDTDARNVEELLVSGAVAGNRGRQGKIVLGQQGVIRAVFSEVVRRARVK